MSLRNQPYFPLYIQDYLTDEKLNECSFETQGIYIKIMCVLHKQEVYGCILFKQKDKQNFNKENYFASILSKHLPVPFEKMVSALTELFENNVLIFDGEKMIQKRMYKDGQVSLARSKAGKTGGGNPILFKQKDKQTIKQIDKLNTEYEYDNEIKIKEGGTGETIKIDLIKNEKMPIGWANTVSEFLNDYEFKKSCCQFYSAEWSEVEDRMVKFIQGVHLKQQFQDIAALKTHFRNHYKKHYINGGSSVKEIKEKNQGALSNGFIEAPKNFDYDKMGKW